MIYVLSGVKLQDFTDTLEESHLVIIPSEFFDLLRLPFWLLFPYGDIFDQELDYASTDA
jgi:hypothetical protein